MARSGGGPFESAKNESPGPPPYTYRSNVDDRSTPRRWRGWIPSSCSGRNMATKRPSRASPWPWPWATGSMRWRSGSCATPTSPRMLPSTRCSASGGTLRNFATRRTLTPGRTGSLCVPVTPRDAGPGNGHAEPPPAAGRRALRRRRAQLGRRSRLGDGTGRGCVLELVSVSVQPSKTFWRWRSTAIAARSVAASRSDRLAGAIG